MTTRLLSMGAAFLALGCGGSTEYVPAPAPAPTPVTVAPPTPQLVPVPGAAEIEALIAELYAVISGPAGEERDWARLRALFAPGARLAPMTRQLPPDSMHTGPRPAMMILSVEDYIERAGPFLMRDGFFETEVHNEIERYGNVAHVWSTYESRTVSPDTEPVDRGINSIQLVYGEGRWWVYSVLWHSERSGAGPIPADYLP